MIPSNLPSFNQDSYPIDDVYKEQIDPSKIRRTHHFWNRESMLAQAEMTNVQYMKIRAIGIQNRNEDVELKEK